MLVVVLVVVVVQGGGGDGNGVGSLSKVVMLQGSVGGDGTVAW